MHHIFLATPIGNLELSPMESHMPATISPPRELLTDLHFSILALPPWMINHQS